jgi:hypothetical protein
MDERWIAEEQRLWELMHEKPEIVGNRRNKRRCSRIRRAKGKEAEKSFIRAQGLITEQQAAAQSWEIYRLWLDHG